VSKVKAGKKNLNLTLAGNYIAGGSSVAILVPLSVK